MSDTTPKKSINTRRLQWLAIAAVTAVLLVVAGSLGGGPRTAAERGVDLKESIQCPFCQGQSVAESNAAIAASIRIEIDDLIQQGYSDAEIRGRMVSSYGEDVLMRPLAGGVSGLVWVLPVILLIVAGGALFLHLAASEEDRDSLVRRLSTHRGAIMGGLVVLAIAMGFGVAQLSGERIDRVAVAADLSTSSSALLIEAQDLADAGEIVESLKVYDAILADEPENHFALARRGWLLVQTGEESFFDRAEILLLEAIEVEPDFAESYLYLGFLYRQEGDDEAAVVAYRRFLELGGDGLPDQMREGVQRIVDELEA
ncbi:MAG: cytochrome c-type biogenesis protein CcmH [Acidimicrobiales bacterium]